jgi:hypothetical protein
MTAEPRWTPIPGRPGYETNGIDFRGIDRIITRCNGVRYTVRGRKLKITTPVARHQHLEVFRPVATARAAQARAAARTGGPGAHGIDSVQSALEYWGDKEHGADIQIRLMDEQ